MLEHLPTASTELPSCSDVQSVAFVFSGSRAGSDVAPMSSHFCFVSSSTYEHEEGADFAEGGRGRVVILLSQCCSKSPEQRMSVANAANGYMETSSLWIFWTLARFASVLSMLSPS